MPKTRFYRFAQNNSGGRIRIDTGNGIGREVWIEAHSAAAANDHAERIGIYFDGVDDCACCGSRWERVRDDDDGDSDYYSVAVRPKVFTSYSWMKEDNVGFLHLLDGTIKSLKPSDWKSKTKATSKAKAPAVKLKRKAPKPKPKTSIYADIAVGDIVQALKALDPAGANVKRWDLGVVFADVNYYGDQAGHMVRWFLTDSGVSGACNVYAGDVKKKR